MTTVAIINARLLDPASDYDGPGGGNCCNPGIPGAQRQTGRSDWQESGIR